MQRSTKIVKNIMIFTIFSILITGCVPKKQSYSAEFMILFNTVTKIISYSESEEELDTDWNTLEQHTGKEKKHLFRRVDREDEE